MLSPSSAVPHTMLSQSAPPQSVPHTMLSSSSVPHTMLSPSSAVPQTMLSPSSVPQTMLSQSASPQAVPHTMLSPSSVLATPQLVPTRNALAFGSSEPLPRRWLPQMMCLLHIFWTGTVAPGCRGRVETREADGADGVQEAGALRQRVVVRILLRGVLQDRLHRVRRQVRVRLEHQRDGAGDDRAPPCWCRSGSDTAAPDRARAGQQRARPRQRRTCCRATRATRCRCRAQPGRASRSSRCTSDRAS